MLATAIGLTALIKQVKAELQSYEPGTGKAPLFYIKELTLEFKVRWADVFH